MASEVSEDLLDDLLDTARDAFHNVYDGDNFDASLRHAIEAVLKQLGEGK